ncbi:MAG: hypothetical protein CLLPBCKN_003484 [Chroococcidiopsis cubana SAG 39.79]|uniref:Glycosyl transferase n=1 Tax=Chroococcidiopsis cubana SAG 39.79 TaxID=388085 RepID=A0AB37ULN3_9CYAN|nr:glycosyltransferase [Chroococcidiopsis cubana]MDZ4874088.1 hypothetical protein [Chroococcidiopsis cubana SAG 39.79]PSB64982.1 glycosyl transferase family 2 [Chroococcidiopsis cubana CCALA 043]RUT12239.1 glycosyl transferase [Chroococcidiopsis cubana SAG 39.79]
MDVSKMAEPQVTIVVVPRERFSLTQKSLESIYENTTIPFKLIYVDGGSPARIRDYLAAQAREKNFQLIRTDYYPSPNYARNLGLAQVNTEYVVFMDNDVVVAPNWLNNLVQCAEETGAAVVSPLVCQGQALHEIVHCAGGESAVIEENKGDRPTRRLHDKIYKQGKRVADLGDFLQRQPTGLAEFHCMLVRTAIIEKIGGQLDPAMMNTKEHVDFCVAVSEAGGSIYLEPTSLVTYINGMPLELSEIPFYMVRWSDAWGTTSLNRLREKWNLTEDKYHQNWYRSWSEYLTGRRRVFIIRPLLNKYYVFGRGKTRLENMLVRMEKRLNRYLSDRHTRKHPQEVQQQPAKSLPKTPVSA